MDKIRIFNKGKRTFIKIDGTNDLLPNRSIELDEKKANYFINNYPKDILHGEKAVVVKNKNNNNNKALEKENKGLHEENKELQKEFKRLREENKSLQEKSKKESKVDVKVGKKEIAGE